MYNFFILVLHLPANRFIVQNVKTAFKGFQILYFLMQASDKYDFCIQKIRTFSYKLFHCFICIKS